MNRIKRTFSLLVRKIKKPFAAKGTINTLRLWRNELVSLPPYRPVPNKILLIRSDEIGDYILWRNYLPVYKSSPRWKHHQITLLGNQAWKSIFDYADKDAVDASIWIDKNEYTKNETYRRGIWQQLREEGFETVICPSKTRTVLIDDVCMLATGAPDTIASGNAFAEEQTNLVSDQLYKHLHHNKRSYHDFLFNQNFTNWCCHTNYDLPKPVIDASLFHQVDNHYILCYISASRRSKRLPAALWISLIKQLQQRYTGKIVLSGGPAEKLLSEQIATNLEVENITGKTSLIDMIHYTAGANAVITGDTMEAHLAPSCNTPTVIVASGLNFDRFTSYKEAGIANVETVYAKPFLRKWKKKHYALFPHYLAVTSDIETISAEDILQALQKLKPDL